VITTADTTAGGQGTGVLVAGVGNIFLGDDGFGCEVARRLAELPLPPGVRVRDYGTGGLHLAYDLVDGCDLLVLVDAAPRGRAPGDLTLLEVDAEHIADGALDTHGMHPEVVLGTVAKLGGRLPRTLVVACEPATIEEHLGLSTAMTAAVEPAMEMVHEVLDEHLSTTVGRPVDREPAGKG
jgi:hydrogenase maturation protease